MEGGVQESEELDFGEKPISSYLQTNLSVKSGVHASRSESKNSNSDSGKIRMCSESTPEPRKKRRRKEVPLSSFQTPKKWQNGFHKPDSRGSGFSLSGLHGCSPNMSNFSDNLCKPVIEVCSDSSEKNDNHDSHAGDSKEQHRLDDNIFIPKRPRGTFKRKKHEGLTSSKTLITDPLGSCISTENRSTKTLKVDADHPSRLSDGAKKNFSESREKGLTRRTSRPSVKRKNGENNEILMKVNGTKDHRKRTKSSLEENKTLVEDGKHSNDSNINCGNLVDDDEENLEQNAARMLSSRFDPKCAAFSGSSTASSLRSAKQPSSSRFSGSKLKGLVSDKTPIDAAGRVLRLRKRNRKGFARKRRHFYEVCSQSLDPYSLLRQRIRVFWPLDKSWYFGFVKDYDPETRMHYIKYDDREEEWIDLQKERFKLLLFPSEITDAHHSEKHKLESNLKRRKGDKNATDGSSFGSLNDSEPIISWLARSSDALKSLSANLLRKQRRNGMIKEKRCISKFSSRLVAPTALTDRHRIRFVYSRRRFRDKRKMHVEDSAQEPNLSIYSKEWTQMTLKLAISLEHFMEFSTGPCSFWLFHSTFLLQYGVIRPLWPLVHMEVVLSDSVMGLRFLYFEGCLRWATILMCLIATTFCQQEEGIKLTGNQMPSMSVCFKLSSLHDQGRELIFILCSFLQFKKSRWRCLEDRLKDYVLENRELPVVKCMGTSINTLQCDCSHILCTSNTNCSSSLEGFSGGCVTDTVNQITIKEPFNTKLKPASPFFPSCHLKLLMQKNTAIYGYNSRPSAQSKYYRDNHPKLASSSGFLNDKKSDQTSGFKTGSLKLGTLLSKASASSGMTSGEPMLENRSGSVCNDDCISSSGTIVNSVNNNAIGIIHMDNTEDNQAAQLEKLSCHSEPDRDANRFHATLSEKSPPVKPSLLGVKDVQVREFNEVKVGSDLDGTCSLRMAGETNEVILHSPRTAPRSTWYKNQHRSDTTKFSQGLTNNEDFLRNGSSLSSRKPRTHVLYSFPWGDDEPGFKPQNDYKKVRPHKKIRTVSIRRMPSSSRSHVSYLESLTCDANVLVTAADRGWRECGAQVILESADHQEWRISVKISGNVRYVYKPHQLLQPGTTNRYTHAMMWKGGKDWTLEFIDRSQWSLFKEMHEQCFNRNIRAAYAKNIPTPGVRLVEDAHEHVVEVPFFRNSSNYIRQNGTEVDVALDPSRVFYDMDSSDEEWLDDFRCSMDDKEDNDFEITDYLFEKVLNMFEKLAYTHAGVEFTSDDIEEYMAEIGPVEIIKAIYEYWRNKRQKKGIPLIRQFQPALWELYQCQLKEWESALCKLQNGTDSLPHKPPMFAFCLRPRGLEVPNKGSNQRSHKKFMYAGFHNVFIREQESFHGCGRKSNGYTIGEEKGLAVGIPTYESSDSFNWRHCSSSFSPGFLPRDTAMAGASTMSSDGSEGSHAGFSRSKTNKTGILLSPRDSLVMPFSHNMKTRSNGFQNFDFCERQTRKQYPLDEFQWSRADIDEFSLRDAANTARYASNIAKFKKEKAQWLLRKADLALHKANAALIIAEAIKASEERDMDEDPSSDEELTSD